MAGARRLVVEILGDAKGLGRAFAEAEGSAKKLGDGLDDTGEKSSKLADGMSRASIVAGAAVAAFAVKAVKDFQDTALEAGRFGESAGIGVEAASQWMEVAGDLGIGAGTIESSFQRFNVAVGKGAGALNQFGVEVVRAKDGTIDANQSFINAITTIGKIPDASRRAKASQELFGRSFTDIAELMSMDADELRLKLEGVGDAQLIDPEELQKARDGREAMDSFGDAINSVSMSVGEMIVSLSPMLERFAAIVQVGADYVNVGIGDAIQSDASGWDKFKDALVPVDDLWEAFNPKVNATLNVLPELRAEIAANRMELDDTATVQDDYNAALVEAYTRQYEAGKAAEEHAAKLAKSQAAAQRAREEQQRLAESARQVELRVRDQMAAWDEIFGRLDDDQALLDIGTAFDDLGAKWMTTTAQVQEGAISQETAMREVAGEINAVKEEVGLYAKDILGLPASRVTEFLALIDEQKYEEVERRLGILSRNRDMVLSITAKGGIGAGSFTVKVDQFDTGGVVPGPIGAPRLIMAHGGEEVVPRHNRAAMAAGGYAGITVINYISGSVVTERDLERAVASGILDMQRRGEFPGSLS